MYQINTYLSAFFATFDINLDVDATLISLLRLSSELSQAPWALSTVRDFFMLEEMKKNLQLQDNNVTITGTHMQMDRSSSRRQKQS